MTLSMPRSDTEETFATQTDRFLRAGMNLFVELIPAVC
jgi:hypothetical protein